jgi:toxin ParE1/3/4
MTTSWRNGAQELRVRWLKQAGVDLESAEEYIAKHSPVAAAQIVLKIVKAVALLKHQPGIGRPGRIPGTKELVVPETPYIVPYRIMGDTVQVLRVYHTSRKWPECL